MSSLPHEQIVQIRFRDTDSQGHLYFANYLVLADESVGFYMEELGFGAMNPREESHMIFTVNLNCDYLGECKAHDKVRVRTGYTRLGNSSAGVGFEIYHDDDGSLLAQGTFTQVFVDPQTRKADRIPEHFRQAILQHQPELVES